MRCVILGFEPTNARLVHGASALVGPHAALKAGLHVVVEKPISAHKADAERLLAVRKEHPKQVFAAMFQLRTESRYVEIKKLLDARELGKVARFCWIATDWFRTEAYYASGGWRATWKGE